MPRPSSVDVEHAALQLCREAEDHMRDHHFTNLRSINTGAESVKSHFSCGAENAKKIHERAVKLLQEKGYLQFKASMGKQVAFCKKGDMEPARAEEFEKTYSKFVEVTKRPGESQDRKGAGDKQTASYVNEYLSQQGACA
ncbi:unnamed protein product [Effrenium voratum]|uniref:Uncharacterized protein n=1 Tax=Effrenium voratum TaxID=2562239 RepID=A0AA36J1Q2_9DINO|nr:unnamed protein product [Effrenium voratum]CAJ1447861.1 unnamed protein product [Effrenium voratum]